MRHRSFGLGTATGTVTGTATVMPAATAGAVAAIIVAPLTPKEQSALFCTVAAGKGGPPHRRVGEGVV